MIKIDGSKPVKNQHSICIELLKKFSPKEIESFTSFVESRYFNSDELVVKLLFALKEWVLDQPHFDLSSLYMVYKEVFEEKVFKASLTPLQKKQFNYKLSALLRLAERFLVVEGLEENLTYYNDLLFQKILEKQQFKLFNRHIKRYKKQLATASQKNSAHYEQKEKLEKQILYYLFISNRLTTQDNLSAVIYYTDLTYLIDKLRLQSTLLYLESVNTKKYDTSSIEAITGLLKLPQYANHPLIKIHQAANQLTKTQNETVYNELLILLETHSFSITKADLKGFYVIAANFCSLQIQKGAFDFKHLFELYKTMDEKNLLIEANSISVDELKTIVIAGCRIGEFEWTLQMIEKYQPFIVKQVRESVYHFNLGVVAFYQQDYEKALHHFIRVESVNFNYDVNCRVIMMKTHYECDKEYDERTLQIFRSAEKYFNENKQLTPQNKKAYKNFIRTLINVYRIRFGATKMKLVDLKTKLEKQEVNSDKKWLMQKIEEFFKD